MKFTYAIGAGFVPGSLASIPLLRKSSTSGTLALGGAFWFVSFGGRRQHLPQQIFSDMILFRDLVKFIAYSSAMIVFIITYGSNTVELFVKWEIISLADGKITVIPLANYL